MASEGKETMSAETREQLTKAVNLIKNAPAVVLAAGAGLSVPAGIDYHDTVGFRERYPGLAKMGFRFCYEMIGQPLEPEYKWAYAAVHGNWMMTHGARGDDPTYQGLRQLVGDKPCSVLTTNVDGLFKKNGFPEEKIYTPQGSMALLQCLSPSCKYVYDARPVVNSLLAHIDLATTRLTDLSKIPVCPKCGSDVYFNVNGGSWYVNSHWEPQRKAFNEFVQEYGDKGLVIVEVGVGFNTPGVIRWPMEKLCRNNSGINLIRINLEHPEFDSPVPEDQGASLGLDCTSAIRELVGSLKPSR